MYAIAIGYAGNRVYTEKNLKLISNGLEKMNLYHYTSVTLLHSILTSEGINKGYFQLIDSTMLYGHCWYTTSPLPYGHGLCDGTELLNQSQKEFVRKAAGTVTYGSVNRLQNKRIIRLSVDTTWLKQQDSFYSFRQIMRQYNQPSIYAKVLGICGWVDTKTLSDSELKRWYKSTKLKHDTWYVHKGTLPVERILSVDFMEKPDIYVPYDFESHGRKELERNGIYCITKEQYAELNECQLGEIFLGGEVLVICPHPDSVPSIIFRKRNSAHVLAIDDGKYIGGEGNHFSVDSLKKLSCWVLDNSESLSTLWERSKENWYKLNF